MKEDDTNTPHRRNSASLNPPTDKAEPSTPVDSLIKKAEAAERLRISVRTLDTWLAQGRIPYLKISKSVRLRWSDIIAHLQRNRVN